MRKSFDFNLNSLQVLTRILSRLVTAMQAKKAKPLRVRGNDSESDLMNSQDQPWKKTTKADQQKCFIKL